LKEHSSVKRLRGLSEDDLVAIPWLPEAVARAVYAKLHDLPVTPTSPAPHPAAPDPGSSAPDAGA
jgi:hypothetical protein